MSEETRAEATSRKRRTPRLRLGAVLAVALAAGFVAWFFLRDDESHSTSGAQAAPAEAVSADQVRALAASVHHPVFWLGPRNGFTYELTQTPGGKIYIRYLPAGVEVGAKDPYLTVATYPFPGAFAAVRKEASARGAVAKRLSRRGIAVLDAGYPQSVHIAYPAVDYQVEVFDPTPARAMQMVAAGQVAIVGDLKAARLSKAGPQAASIAELRSLSRSLGHPIYWAGPRRRFTYELTQTSSGRVFIRYLPPGVKVGDPKANYLTVATYPFPGALAAIERQARGKAGLTIKLPPDGLAVVDGQYPKSIHLAFEGSDYQVEVFNPSPRRARQVVASGKITPIR